MSRLNTYGSAVGLTVQNFPDCVDPEYLEAWASYITTQTAVDLFQSLPQPFGMQRVVEGFLSSIGQTSSSFLLRPVADVTLTSLKEAKALLKIQHTELNAWLTRIEFKSHFRLAQVLTRTNSDYNRVANCINTTMDIYLVYIPKTTRTGIPKVGEILRQKSPYWFSGKQPKALFKTDNLTKKFMRSPVPVLTDTYPSVQQAMLAPRSWFQWNDSLGADCIRVKGNAIAIHVQSRRLCCFLSRHRKTAVEKKLNSLVKAIFI